MYITLSVRHENMHHAVYIYFHLQFHCHDFAKIGQRFSRDCLITLYFFRRCGFNFRFAEAVFCIHTSAREIYRHAALNVT